MASVRKRILPSGRVCWLVAYEDQYGKRRAKQFERKKDAEAWKADALVQIRQGTHVPDSEPFTVGDAADLWLESCEARMEAGRQMERSTYLGYEIHVRLHIRDGAIGIAGVKLSRLNKQAVTIFRDRLLRSGRSEAITRKILTSLKLIIDHAREQQLIAVNPAHGVRVLKTTRAKPRIATPSPKDVNDLINAAADDFKPHVMVAALCGLRASESRGLPWSNVDFDEGYIHVRQRADRFNKIGEPKSEAGVRSVPVGPLVMSTLRRWKLRCPPSDLGLVFPNKLGKVLNYSNMWERDFQPLLRTLKISLRWHDLRHFAVSLWIEQGFPPKAIMEFAGHASINLTFDRYGHLFPSPDHHAGMEEIERRLFGMQHHNPLLSITY